MIFGSISTKRIIYRKKQPFVQYLNFKRCLLSILSIEGLDDESSQIGSYKERDFNQYH